MGEIRNLTPPFLHSKSENSRFFFAGLSLHLRCYNFSSTRFILQAEFSFVMKAMSYVLFAGGGAFLKDRDRHGPTRGVCVLALNGTEAHRDNQQAPNEV